ncbi:MAG: lactate utilization protein [Actinobacteria bacterium]|nr:lactate utilization protein [Actinomycetota bacterium]
MNNWNKLVDRDVVERTMSALKANGIEAYFVENREAARAKVLEFLPKEAEVMNMTSMTLEAISVAKEIIESGNYDSIRNRLQAMDRETHGSEMQQLGAAPQWVVGSVHAVTEAGQILVASMTGSQIPAYAYGSGHVIWVVGTQKIVKDINGAMKRIYEYCLPMETERAMEAYGISSSVNKILIINKEVQPGRISLIFVNELLGF